MSSNRGLLARASYYGLILTVCYVTTSTTSTAKVTCIRVISEHTADTTDLKRFRQFPAWRDKTGNDLAEAVSEPELEQRSHDLHDLFGHRVDEDFVALRVVADHAEFSHAVHGELASAELVRGLVEASCPAAQELFRESLCLPTEELKEGLGRLEELIHEDYVIGK